MISFLSEFDVPCSVEVAKVIVSAMNLGHSRHTVQAKGLGGTSGTSGYTRARTPYIQNEHGGGEREKGGREGERGEEGEGTGGEEGVSLEAFRSWVELGKVAAITRRATLANRFTAAGGAQLTTAELQMKAHRYIHLLLATTAKITNAAAAGGGGAGGGAGGVDYLDKIALCFLLYDWKDSSAGVIG